ncbi:hypothetical protein [Herbidospora mongoliensis]|uniref:hypothetical protein n=1 Tax=Herbidospora mongoliensis TaxID=688067 RepID=UPI00082A9606|nr:hypothetical protein [Herbidospora mongoliensis]
MTDLTEILPDLAGWPPAEVALDLWPVLMRCARETLVPWVDAHLPELANAARIAFLDLRDVSAELHLLVRASWTRLRRALLADAVAFLTAGPEWLTVRVVVWLRPWYTGSVVEVAAEYRLDLPVTFHRVRVELLSPRDRLLVP